MEVRGCGRSELRRGGSFGGSSKTTGTIRAARVSDMLYMVLQYRDPAHSGAYTPVIRRFGPVRQSVVSLGAEVYDAG
jgi:hypothetical protein